MAIELTPAPDAERIARELIPECHPHLAEATILYLFTNQRQKKGGYVTLGTAKKASALQRYLSGTNGAEVDFILQFNAHEWEDLAETQRKALVDHELCHCARKDDPLGEPVWSIRRHDVEEFRAVIDRHGLWKVDVMEFAQSVRQLRLPEVAGEKE